MNTSFVFPRRTSLLHAYYQNIPGIYTLDFPPVPPVQFDYTGNVSWGLWQPRFGTKLYKLKFGSNVRIVFKILLSSLQRTILYIFMDTTFGLLDKVLVTSMLKLILPTLTWSIRLSGTQSIFLLVDGQSFVPWLIIQVKNLISSLEIFLCGRGWVVCSIVENGIGEVQTMEPPPPDLPQC